MSEVIPEIKLEDKKSPEVTPVVLTPVVEESEKEINWKKFKEARAKEREQAEIMTKRAAEKEAEATALKAALEAIVNKGNNPSRQSKQLYDDQEETEDQRIEKKVNALLEKREQDRQKKRAEEAIASLPEKLKTIHKDFDQVCSSANLDYLEYHHPELSRSLSNQPQSFEKWNDIYSAIKRYIPNTEAKKEQVKSENNFNKPQSISSPAASQANANIYDMRTIEQRRAENYARMQKLIKGI